MRGSVIALLSCLALDACGGGAATPAAPPPSPPVASVYVAPAEPATPPPAASSTPDLPVHRCLAPDVIRTVVFAHRGALRACYERGSAKEPTLHGTVTVWWTVTPSGDVTDAKVAGSTSQDDDVGRCIVEQVKQWKFPSADGPSTIKFPFAFGETL